MSAAQVRAALQQFFTTPAITGLQRVYLDEPWWWDDASWDVTANQGWGAVAFVHFTTFQETRATLPAVTGEKEVVYQVGLAVQYKYLVSPDPLPGQAEDAWVIYLDEILDGIRARIHSDPTAGTGYQGVVFQIGQANQGIRISQDLPTYDEGTVLSWNLLEFEVTEIITA